MPAVELAEIDDIGLVLFRVHHHETLRRALPDFRKLAVEEFIDKYAAATAAAHIKVRT